MNKLLSTLFLVIGFIFSTQAQNYSPIQINPYFSQFKALRALNYGHVLSPDTILVKGSNGWIAGYPMSDMLRSNTTYSNPSWIATLAYSKITGAPTLSAVSLSGEYGDLLNKPSLFSGSYTDLTNKPTSFPSTITLVTGLQEALDGKQPTGSYLTAEADPIWTADKVGYRTKVQNDALYYPISTNPSGYLTTVPAQAWASITGKPTFATVATSGDYDDLSNKPTIPTTTSQLTNNSGFTTQADARAVISLTTTGAGASTYDNSTGVLNIPTPKRIETYSGTTDANGAYTVTFATAFPVAPNVQASISNQGSANQIIRVSNVTTTGFTINVFQRNAVTLLAIEVLLANIVSVSGATVDVLVVSK